MSSFIHWRTSYQSRLEQLAVYADNHVLHGIFKTSTSVKLIIGVGDLVGRVTACCADDYIFECSALRAWPWSKQADWIIDQLGKPQFRIRWHRFCVPIAVLQSQCKPKSPNTADALNQSQDSPFLQICGAESADNIFFNTFLSSSTYISDVVPLYGKIESYSVLWSLVLFFGA